ncbi:hypothetical protein LINPERHAP1_LOCUS12994 [Linum perenne]
MWRGLRGHEVRDRDRPRRPWVEVQVDSRVAISLIFGAENVHHQHASKVSSIRALLRRDYEVTISHVYREGNYATDYLADIGHGFPPRDSLD